MSKVILTHEVTGLGSAGDIVEVKNGYGRNYLIPQGFAVAWSRGGEKQIEQIKAARTARELATVEEAQDLKAKLEATKVKLTVKAGKEGRLFGSVKTSDIADAVWRPASARSTSARSSSPTRSRRLATTRQRFACARTCRPRSPFRWLLPSSSRTGF
jgi:ribosomal protein L9